MKKVYIDHTYAIQDDKIIIDYWLEDKHGNQIGSSHHHETIDADKFLDFLVSEGRITEHDDFYVDCFEREYFLRLYISNIEAQAFLNSQAVAATA